MVRRFAVGHTPGGEYEQLRAGSLGGGLGIGWFLREVDGVRTIGHGGSGNGRPPSCSSCPSGTSRWSRRPHGHLSNQAVARWVLERYLGVVERDPEPVACDGARAREVAGRYTIDAMNLDIADDGVRLTPAVEIKPEIREAADADMPDGLPPATATSTSSRRAG